MKALYRIRKILTGVYSEFLRSISTFVVERWYDGFWDYRNYLINSDIMGGGKTKQLIYRHYMNKFGAFIGLSSEIAQSPNLPHNLHGVFISEKAKIGKNVTIYHHVTIGGNLLEGSKGFGSPSIEDGCLIGAGAKIIGNVTVGRNSRIGAGCTVTMDVPPNSVIISAKPHIIQKEGELNNKLLPQESLLKV